MCMIYDIMCQRVCLVLRRRCELVSTSQKQPAVVDQLLMISKLFHGSKFKVLKLKKDCV